MPRYFHEIRSETEIYEDPDGDVYPNDAALSGAGRLTLELSEEDRKFDGSTLIVMDEAGKAIAELAIGPGRRWLQ